MTKKVLFILSSHDKLGNSGKPTGWYLSEASHPWESLKKGGFEIDICSPKGGEAPLDPTSDDRVKDLVNKAFMEDHDIARKLKNTLRPEQVNPKDYMAIHFVGGHGCMFDVVTDQKIHEIAMKIYEEQHGVISAVCHGPAGITNLKLKDGSYFVRGKNLCGFSNEEEEIVKLTQVVPYSLEDRLKERGANYKSKPAWSSHVIVDGNLITGQNPQSAKELGEKLTTLIQQVGQSCTANQ
ncbi:hypothetical protein PPL_04451 [Heterostelium album PN500]|uniref:DJ-1/PfpI domain-containing protein n=1 Tax=Heterostelium pallidum (strain ATCC 26659 / Pp 5 / PN500) TaxID=670386 RepID=D3B7L3_HETP5|nr:hypothetical protein PPL_04451 [Heterostelium album PN500]EFA82756.1 hypothetical protein PPL_04451 [Heterostelium album PN500]|eukprot:XP_020434873.1 hypothetical protein PPL_04451 [Heterostelium album PN500]